MEVPVSGIVPSTDPLRTGDRVVRDAPIGAWRIRLTPPAYSGLPSRVLGDTNAVRALSGTRIELLGADMPPDSIRVRSLSDSTPGERSVTVQPMPDGWLGAVVATDGPLEVRATRGRHAKLLLVEGVADSIPRVTLTAPGRDSVLQRAGQLRWRPRMTISILRARSKW
jgi:hypothetical protein